MSPILLVALCLASVPLPDEPPPDVTTAPPVEEFVVVPLRVHLLTSEKLPDADCKLTEADVRRIMGKLNAIWHPAGIHFGLESVVREPASRVERFRLAARIDEPEAADGGDDAARPTRRPALGLYRMLIPEGPSRSFDGLHVYFIHDFAVNGVYMGSDFAIVKETARLRKVPGGIDEPLPRVTAHELGHALGLSHRQDRTNLLASGTTGTLLNRAEVETAREKVTRIPGALDVPTIRERLGSEDDGETSEKLRRWLDQLPTRESGESKRSDGP